MSKITIRLAKDWKVEMDWELLIGGLFMILLLGFLAYIEIAW